MSKKKPLTIVDAISLAGGASEIAKACDLSARAIYKWKSNGKLPRTEYSGETEYSKRMAELSKARKAKGLIERSFTADELLKALKAA